MLSRIRGVLQSSRWKIERPSVFQDGSLRIFRLGTLDDQDMLQSTLLQKKPFTLTCADDVVILNKIVRVRSRDCPRKRYILQRDQEVQGNVARKLEVLLVCKLHPPPYISIRETSAQPKGGLQKLSLYFDPNQNLELIQYLKYHHYDKSTLLCRLGDLHSLRER
jgi:hypothetical protein